MSHADPAQPTAAQAARTSITLNPVTVTWAVSTAATIGAGFGLNLTKDQAGAVVTIITALAAVVAALTTRPWYVAGVTGATTSALAACAAFGLKLTPEQVAAAASALGMVLGVLSTGSIVPVAAARAGVTATAVQLGKAELPAPPPPRRARPRKPKPPPEPPTAPLPELPGPEVAGSLRAGYVPGRRPRPAVRVVPRPGADSGHAAGPGSDVYTHIRYPPLPPRQQGGPDLHYPLSTI